MMIDVKCKYIIETVEFWLRIEKLARLNERRQVSVVVRVSLQSRLSNSNDIFMKWDIQL
jgi:hypothetical protein